jgi:hypothetical protein
MQTYEIPREEWPMAVTAFGEERHRWLVSLEVLGAEIGAQPEVHDLPLEGLSAEPAEKGGTIFIFVERSADDHLTHVITNPARIRVEENDNRTDAMQIEAADGTRTIVTFVPPPTQAV